MCTVISYVHSDQFKKYKRILENRIHYNLRFAHKHIPVCARSYQDEEYCIMTGISICRYNIIIYQ